MTIAKNAILIVLDSLNRHLLGAYGGEEFDTPNLDAFAENALVFDQHQVGSLPCMPARHDMLCGVQDFLWRPWGSIELWEAPITRDLERAGVTTMLVSDHPHLFESGGENYHCDFTAWEYLRGHEGDPWRTAEDPTWSGAPALPARRGHGHAYDLTRTYFREEADYPGPKTMTAAADWLRRQAPHHDRFFMLVDEFDPHEPFDTPEPWASRYGEPVDGERIIWPPYAIDAVARGRITAAEGRQVRNNYGAKLSMIDHWLGRVLTALEETGRREDTMVIITTDHGHYLGERDLFGKPGVPHYEPLSHIPLMIQGPGIAPGRYPHLSTTVDIHATLCDLFDLTPSQKGHGASLLPALANPSRKTRDWALAGVFGRWVQITDGRYKYARGPVDPSNLPLSLWSNRWSTMPVRGMASLRLPEPDHRAFIDFMPGATIPVLRQPFAPGDPLPYWALGMKPDQHVLFDLENDPEEAHNLCGTAQEQQSLELLSQALHAVNAPEEQWARLGLKL